MTSAPPILPPLHHRDQRNERHHGAQQPVIVPVKSDTQVRPATVGDLAYIESLTNKLSYELGFIPRVALVNRIEGKRGGGVTMALENDDLAGFLHYGSMRSPTCRIFQAAIQYDAQRRHHGEQLVRHFESHARDNGTRLITLHCLHDLDANNFWKQMGYRRVGVERGAKGPLIHWIKLMLHPEDLANPRFIPPPIPRRTHPCPTCGRATTRTFGPKGQIYKTCRPCTFGPTVLRGPAAA